MLLDLQTEDIHRRIKELFVNITFLPYFDISGMLPFFFLLIALNEIFNSIKDMLIQMSCDFVAI